MKGKLFTGTARVVYGSTTRYYLGDKEVTRAEYDAAVPSKPIEAGSEVLSGSTSAWQDFQSEALAVHPKQVKEANERSKRHNLGVVYDAKGLAHIPDRAARKRLLKLEGVHDKAGGYGD